ncbi:MAG: TM2 domain-containing protein [Oscillospiraceae bacterium]
MYCSNCGTKIEPGVQYCLNCGVKVSDGSAYNSANTAYAQGTAKQKSKFVAGILAILLGTLGIHNFYLGYTSKGVGQLLLFVFFLGWVSFIWGIIDAIMIFTDRTDKDAYGVPLSDNI